MITIKLLPVIFLAFYLSSPAMSQDTSDTISHYILQKFVLGKVVMKNGKTEDLKLNYNSATEEMVFENQGKYLAIANIKDVDTVIIEDRVFIPVGKVFYEVAVPAKTPLLIQYTCSVIPPGKPSGYGTTSQTSSVDVINSMVQSGKVYDLKMSGEFTIIPSSSFFLKANEKFVRITNARQVINAFPDKEEEIKDFIKQNKTDFKDRQDLSELIVFCNK